MAVKFNRVLGTEPKDFLETLQAVKDKIPQFERWAKKSKQDADQWKRSKYKDHVFTANLLAALLKYTAQDTEPPLFKYMNDICYTPSRAGLEELVDYMWLLLHSMAALEPIGNRTVYRGVKKDLTAKYNKDSEGAEVTWHSFTSCTRKLGLMDDPNFCGTSGKRTIFSVHLTQGQGRYIAPYSNFPNEEEVLLPPGCRFRIESVTQQGDLTIVQLEEVESLEWIVDLRELAEVRSGASCSDSSPTQGDDTPVVKLLKGPASTIAPATTPSTSQAAQRPQWRFEKAAPAGFRGSTVEHFGHTTSTWLTILDGAQVAQNQRYGDGCAELREALPPAALPTRLSIEMPDAKGVTHLVYIRHPDHERSAGVAINAAGRYHVTITMKDLQVRRCDCGGENTSSSSKSCDFPWTPDLKPLKFGVYLFVESKASVAPSATCTWA